MNQSRSATAATLLKIVRESTERFKDVRAAMSELIRAPVRLRELIRSAPVSCLPAIRPLVPVKHQGDTRAQWSDRSAMNLF